ncbi:high-affinity nickel-transport family protein [Candidatus Daviesbacteria bacterium]|nr:high-affinity nickel-transport family protein [Candidatus Daviesbacteria bacterium]
MPHLISILGLSFLLGMRHATDADHVVAVTTTVSRAKKGILNSALIGILWGIGHSLTVTLVGIPIILYALVVPPRLGMFLEFIVGLMLVILGLLNLTNFSSKFVGKFTQLTIHQHPHPNGNTKHSHIHLHFPTLLNKSFHHLGAFTIIRPITVGLVHGLAGSAAIALLILSTIKNTTLAVFYLFVFHIGVVLGMMVVTILLGASIAVTKRKSQTVNHYLVVVSGFLSLLFGLYIMYQTGLDL